MFIQDDHVALVIRTYLRRRIATLLADAHASSVSRFGLDARSEEEYREGIKGFTIWSASLITERLKVSNSGPLLTADEVYARLCAIYAIDTRMSDGQGTAAALDDALRVVLHELTPVLLAALCPGDDPRTYFQKFFGEASRYAIHQNIPLEEYITRRPHYEVVVRNFMSRKKYLSEYGTCLGLLLKSDRLYDALAALAHFVAEKPRERKFHEGIVSELVRVQLGCGLGRAFETVERRVLTSADRIYMNIPIEL